MKSPFVAVFRHAAAVAVAACFLGANAFAGFTITKNVNAGGTPKEILVVFDKTKNPKAFKPEDRNSNVEFAFANDGALQIKITKQGGSEVILPFPQVVDMTKASYVLLTAKLEGTQSTLPGGVYSGSQLWWSARSMDTDTRMGPAWVNLDSISPDGFLPTTMTTIRLPGIFFAKGGDENRADPTKINALVLYIGGVRENVTRNLTLTIDRISVAE